MAPSSICTDSEEDSSPVRPSKKVARKWSSAEVAALVQGINQVSSASEVPNWAEVARNVPGRTAKQCREKYKNDLRPDLSKQPWVNREEYILARVHSMVGNKWADICRYIPERSENTIKNHWNATLRSKTDIRMKTSFLWTYCHMVQQRGHSLQVFREAKRLYARESYPERQPLEQFEVSDDFLLRVRPPTPGKTVCCLLVAPSHSPVKKRKNKRARRKTPELSATEDATSDDEEDSWPKQDARKRKRATHGPSVTSAPTSGQSSLMTDPILPPTSSLAQPSEHTHQGPAQHGQQLDMDAGAHSVQQYADATVDIHLPAFGQLPKAGLEGGAGVDKPLSKPSMQQAQHAELHYSLEALPVPTWNSGAMRTPTKVVQMQGLSAEEIALLDDFGIETPGTCLLISPKRVASKAQGGRAVADKLELAFVMRECGLAPGETPECERNIDIEDLFGMLQEPVSGYEEYTSPKKASTPAGLGLMMYDAGLCEMLPAPQVAAAAATCLAKQPVMDQHQSNNSNTMQHMSSSHASCPRVDSIIHGGAGRRGSGLSTAASVQDAFNTYNQFHHNEYEGSMRTALEPMGSWTQGPSTAATPPVQANQHAALPANTFWGIPCSSGHVQQSSARPGNIAPGFPVYPPYIATMAQQAGVPQCADQDCQPLTSRFMLRHGHVAEASMMQPGCVPCMSGSRMQPAASYHMHGYSYPITGYDSGIMSSHLTCPLPIPQGQVYPDISGCALVP